MKLESKSKPESNKLFLQMQQFISDQNLLQVQDKVLLGISGGVDSIVLLHLLLAGGYQIGLAHVNYGLRGEESDGDQSFCEALASEFNLPIFVRKVELTNSSRSIQMAAREARYQFFYELCAQEHFSKIILAHHLDDQAETLLMELLRGREEEIFRGIPVQHLAVIRPLAFATKSEIKNYAEQHSIKFREDSSNQEEYYLRNEIRLNILPRLTKIHPYPEKQLVDRKEVYNRQYILLSNLLEPIKKICWKEEKGNITILTHYPEVSALNYATALSIWLEKSGEPVHLRKEIIALISSQKGKQVAGKTKLWMREKDSIIGVPLIRPILSEGYYIPIQDRLTGHEIIDSWEITWDHPEIFEDKDITSVWIDEDKIIGNFIFRYWKPGDNMKPLGLAGSKKISDILTDTKVSTSQRKNQFVLADQEGICYLQNYRISSRVRITRKTKNIVRIRFKFLK